MTAGAAWRVAIALAVVSLRPATATASDEPGGALASAEGDSAVRAVHHAGRTYITFPDEHATGGRLRRVTEVQAARTRAEKRRHYFAVWVVDEAAPTTPTHELAVPVWSALNTARAGRSPARDDVAARYTVIEDEGPLAPGRGLAVFAPVAAGRRCYRAVAVRGGERTLLGEACVDEAPGPGAYVRQGPTVRRRFQGVAGVQVERFVRWEAPPFANKVRALDYLVAVPPPGADASGARPAGLFLHAWGGDLDGGYGVWHGVNDGAVLLATNQEPYDWWSGYHPGVGVDDAQRGPPEPYTARRLRAFVTWAVARYALDPARLFVAGTSMGGTGATALWARDGDLFAWARSDVGVHVPALAPQFRRSFAAVWGDPPPFEQFDHAAFVRANPSRSLPLMVFANGVNDDKVGWAQAVTLLDALQEARQPHVFVWGSRGHEERALLPGGARRGLPAMVATDRPLPAFTRCSLDDPRPRSHQGKRGRTGGQVNLWLLWDTPEETDDDLVLTLWLADGAPKQTARVDVTPRRLQRFRPSPGEVLRVQRIAGDGSIVDDQQIMVDEHGRFTAEQVAVSRERQTLRFLRRP